MSLNDVPEETLKDWREAFSMFDKNGDDLISAGELGTVMRNLGLNPTEEDVKKMISDVDKDGKRRILYFFLFPEVTGMRFEANGFVDFNEFVSMMLKFQERPVDPEEQYLEAFRVFDQDGNGFISPTELQSVMTSLGETLSEEEIKDMIQEADMDRDGQVNYTEFVKVMINKL
nr:calmodulin-beta-like isoform X1 [Crassostrea gigas]XP_034324177.1 calmodulin-beta-like isoform X1 [Crassostrea gigas]